MGTYNSHKTSSLNENPALVNQRNEEPALKNSTTSIERVSDKVLLTEPNNRQRQSYEAVETPGIYKQNTAYVNKGFMGRNDLYEMPNKKYNGSNEQIQIDYDEYWRTKI